MIKGETLNNEPSSSEEKHITVKHGNPFTAAFRGTLGKGLGCFTLIVIAIILLSFGSPSKKKVGVSDELSQSKESDVKEEAQAEVIKTHWEAYTSSIGTNWVIVTGVIKNTGNTKLKLGQASGTIYNTEGKVVGSDTEYVYPEIIAPGEEAYVAATIMDTVKKPEIANARIQFSYNETTEEPIKINVVNDTGKKIDYSYVVTGELENPTDKEIRNVRALVLFYDAEGNLINAEKAYPTPDTLQPHPWRVPFSVSTSHLHELVKSYGVVGYSMQWGF